MARSGDGEQQCGGATRHQARQVPAAPSRELRAVAQVRPLWQMVYKHWKGQPSERLENTVWSQYIPVQRILIGA